MGKTNKHEEWNKKQEELFELFFKQNAEDTINFKVLVDSVKPINDVWQGIYQILEKGIKHFDKFDQVDEIKKITYKNKNYLILKLNVWHYIIIDIETNKTLSKKEVLNEFTESFFINNFNEKNLVK